MEVYPTASVDCLHVGEYIDEVESAATTRSEVVPSRLAGEFHDSGDAGDRLQRFQAILKKDDQVVVVYGHGLKPVVVGNDACLGVWRRSEGQEVLVALFPVGDTVGVFTGNVQVAQ